MNNPDTSTTAGKIAVMQAFEDGKKIQAKRKASGVWVQADAPTWDWYGVEYRIAPEPLELWVNTYPVGSGDIFQSVCWLSEEDARGNVGPRPIRTAVHMREVTE
jgi:hypothetical protein